MISGFRLNQIQADIIVRMLWRSSTILAGVHFVLCLLLMASAVATVAGQGYDIREERAAERRMTTLESSVAGLVEDMRTIKARGNWDWIQQICLALLVGERGTDVLRRRRKQSEED